MSKKVIPESLMQEIVEGSDLIPLPHDSQVQNRLANDQLSLVPQIGLDEAVPQAVDYLKIKRRICYQQE